MDILVSIIAVLSYLYDAANDFLKGIFTPFVCTLIYVGFGLSMLQKHIDKRLDAIEERLRDIQHPDNE